jgi:hypothetical protein
VPWVATPNYVVNRKGAMDNARRVRRWALLIFAMVVALLVSSRVRAQDNAPPPARYPPPPQGRPPPGQYPPSGQYTLPGCPPPGQYPPSGSCPPPTAYAPPGWAPPPPEPSHPRRVFSLTISPIHLVLPVVELTGEARIHDKVGLAVIGGAGKIADFSLKMFEAGAQVRVYVVGDFRHGMQLGAELLYLQFDQDVVTTGEVLAIGPFVGYKVIVDAGFTFDAQLGFAHVSERASSGNNSNSEKYFPLINLNVGWSF